MSLKPTSKPIYGNIVCQDGMPYIFNAINSLHECCDKIYVVDGGSVDGTWEWLNSVKDVYNLELFENPWPGSLLTQRNWLLSQTPMDSWIVALDQDEQLTYMAKKKMKEVLGVITDEELLKCSGEFPVVVSMPFYNLIKDPHHYAADMTTNLRTKVFYYDSDIEWRVEYHCEIGVVGNKEHYKRTIEVIPEIGILHWALLDKNKNEQRCERLKNNRFAGDHEYNIWCKNKHTVEEFPKSMKI